MIQEPSHVLRLPEPELLERPRKLENFQTPKSLHFLKSLLVPTTQRKQLMLSQLSSKENPKH